MNRLRQLRMSKDAAKLDAYEQPSVRMREEWKTLSRLPRETLLQDWRIDDPREATFSSECRVHGHVTSTQIERAATRLGLDPSKLTLGEVTVKYHPILPGLLIIPSLISPALQIKLLDRMMHRDLSNPKHTTNLHLHYDIPYPGGSTSEERSFFSVPPQSADTFSPKDAEVHKPLKISQVLQRRLHWVTLGGQYDWTKRVYPGGEPPQFPLDIASFLGDLFPQTKAEAAILNIYSPGDTMMMHRDVSEETDKGLVSLSFGCDGLFMITPTKSALDEATQDGNGKKGYLLLRLRSGDAIYMTKEARFAWHGVPRVLEGTCPSYLESWPAGCGRFDEWHGWMQNKRINLNVRQMKD